MFGNNGAPDLHVLGIRNNSTAQNRNNKKSKIWGNLTKGQLKSTNIIESIPRQRRQIRYAQVTPLL